MRVLSFAIVALFSFNLQAAELTPEQKEVLEFAKKSPAVKSAIADSKRSHMTWGYAVDDEPTVKQMSGSYSGGNPLGGNGSSQTYLVRFPYHENMDWNGYSESVLVFVSKWHYDSAGAEPEEKGMAILNIIYTSGIKNYKEVKTKPWEALIPKK